MDLPAIIRSVKRTQWLTVLLAVALGLSHGALCAQGEAACAINPDNKALDFWLGEWSVVFPEAAPYATSEVTLDLDFWFGVEWTAAALDATSKVTLDLNKCVQIERWDDAFGHSGDNYFAYNANDKSWQAIFADNEGHVDIFPTCNVTLGFVQFSGQSRGRAGELALNRVTIRRISEDRVEQKWEKSIDEDKTWTTVFRRVYVRRHI